MTSMIKKDSDGAMVVAVVGGGAAGMMAAISAAEMGATVLLFEKNNRTGKKLRITGKGRCNLTNDCDLNTFLANVPSNPRFLYAALSRFGTEDTKSFFEDLGVPLKTERGNRVFPMSDKAGDVVELVIHDGMADYTGARKCLVKTCELDLGAMTMALTLKETASGDEEGD